MPSVERRANIREWLGQVVGLERRERSVGSNAGKMGRRDFALALGVGGAAVFLGAASNCAGCGAYRSEEGEAYAPWDFPDYSLTPQQMTVHAALLAASPYNTQPWLFSIKSDEVNVYLGPSRNLGVLDPLRREMHIGMGCAVENLMIAACTLGLGPELTWFPDADSTHVARVRFTKGASGGDRLFDAIAIRHTNRGKYLNGAPPRELEGALRALVDEPLCGFTFLSDGAAKEAFRQATIDATQAIVGDTQKLDAGQAWWRQTKNDIDQYRDGLTIDTSGLGATIRYLGKVAGSVSAEESGQYWLDGTKGDQTTGFAYCALVSKERASHEQQLRVGRIYQRMQLWASQQGLAMQQLNQTAEMQDDEEVHGGASGFGKRLAELTSDTQSRVQMLFRIGVAWDEALKSPRRPVSWVQL